MNFTKLFHTISYSQYPILLVAMYYVLQPYFNGFESIWEPYNNALIFGGLAISLSTLQDTTTTQNKISQRVWEDPKKGKIALICIAVMCLYFIGIGIAGLYIESEESIIKEMSFGTIVFGIGLLGLLKAAGEMFENHRIDKNPK